MKVNCWKITCNTLIVKRTHIKLQSILQPSKFSFEYKKRCYMFVEMLLSCTAMIWIAFSYDWIVCDHYNARNKCKASCNLRHSHKATFKIVFELKRWNIRATEQYRFGWLTVFKITAYQILFVRFKATFVRFKALYFAIYVASFL